MELLITGALADGRLVADELRQMGHLTHFIQFESEELPCEPERIEGVICNDLFSHHAIEGFERLRFIQLTSAGYDRVPMAYAEEKGIRVFNAGDTYSVPMAEFAIGGVLELYKRFADFREKQKLRCWEKLRDLQELAGKTVCIIGCGNVGRACAKRFSAFDARVLGVDAYPQKNQWFEAIYGMEKLEDVLRESDIAVLSLPLVEETRHLINDEKLRFLKDTAVLVNISRGGIVDTKALIKAMEEKRLAGAVLDVFEEEPLGAENELWNMENVVLTPHNSFVGEGNPIRLKKVIYSNLKRCEWN